MRGLAAPGKVLPDPVPFCKCIAVPGRHAAVTRPALATIAGLDLRGRPLTVTGTGLLARGLRHEADHLDGILYIDRLPAAERAAVLAAAGLDAALSAPRSSV